MLYKRTFNQYSSANNITLFYSFPEIPRDRASWALGNPAIQVGFDLLLVTAALRFTFLESVIWVFETIFLLYAHSILLDLELYVTLVIFYDSEINMHVQSITTWDLTAIDVVVNIESQNS